jgi:hypothetical protein
MTGGLVGPIILGMTTSDYIINALFVFVVLRQARERKLDLRSLLGPLAAVGYVAFNYVHSIPTSGNDLLFAGLLALAGLTLGVLSGFATYVRSDGDGNAYARVGWVAGFLLIAGIGSRLAFAFALSHGAGPAVRDFSISHQISATAWPLALVAMALLEVTTRLAIVHVRGLRARNATAPVAVTA